MNQHRLPVPLQQEFLQFLENHPPQAFSRSLRRLVLDHITEQSCNGTSLHPGFGQLSSALSDLFEILDMAEAYVGGLKTEVGSK